MWMPYQSQLASGWTSLSFVSNFVAVSLLVPSIIYFVPLYEAEAAAWIWVFLNLGYVLVSVQFMYRRILRSEKYYWYIYDLLLPICGVLLVLTAMKYIVLIHLVVESRFDWLGFLFVALFTATGVVAILCSQVHAVIRSVILGFRAGT